MTDRKKPGVAFWATVVVVVALNGYPLSFGPACWAQSRSSDGGTLDAVNSIYEPILWTWEQQEPGWISSVIHWYVNVGARSLLSVGRRIIDDKLVIIQ